MSVATVEDPSDVDDELEGEDGGEGGLVTKNPIGVT